MLGCIEDKEGGEIQPVLEQKEESSQTVSEDKQEEQPEETIPDNPQIPDVDKIIRLTKKQDAINMEMGDVGLIAFTFYFDVENIWDEEIDYMNIFLDPAPESKVQKSMPGFFEFSDIPPGPVKKIKLGLEKHGGFEHGDEFPLNADVLVGVGNETARKTFDINAAIP